MWYQTYAHLSPCTAFFLWHSLASSTRVTYRTRQKSFTDFITLYPQFRNLDRSILPALQTAVIEWVTWLGGVKHLQPKMIKSYVTHLCSTHVDADLALQHVSFPCSSKSSEELRGTWGRKSVILSCP